jgi:hypothetical protein
MPMKGEVGERDEERDEKRKEVEESEAIAHTSNGEDNSDDSETRRFKYRGVLCITSRVLYGVRSLSIEAQSGPG